MRIVSSPSQQDSEFLLQDEKFTVVKGSNKVLPFQISRMGLYMVVAVKHGVVVMWDQKTSVFVKLSPKYQVNPCCNVVITCVIIDGGRNYKVSPGRVKCAACAETTTATARMTSRHAPMKRLQMF